MKDYVMIDSKLKSKVEGAYMTENGGYAIKFVDLDDTFWFDDYVEFQDFINKQEIERFSDKELRKGYFLYTNEHKETFKYIVESSRGNLKLIKEELVELANKD